MAIVLDCAGAAGAAPASPSAAIAVAANAARRAIFLNVIVICCSCFVVGSDGRQRRAAQQFHRPAMVDPPGLGERRGVGGDDLGDQLARPPAARALPDDLLGERPPRDAVRRSLLYTSPSPRA